MYVDSCTYTANGKKYTRHLLRESYRQDGKVRHRTIANLSQCSEEEIQAIKLALKETKNNRKKAARILNVSYKTLLNRLKEFDLSL